MISEADALERAADSIDATAHAQSAALRALARSLRARGSDEWCSIAEVAATMKRTPRAVRGLIKRGKLAAKGEGRDALVARADLERFIANMPAHRVRVDAPESPDDFEAETDALVDEILGASDDDGRDERDVA